MDEKHFAKLRDTWTNTNVEQRRILLANWRPKLSANDWVNYVFQGQLPSWALDLPKDLPNRFEMEDHLKVETDSSRAIAIVFSWGGMGVRNGRLFRENFESYANAVGSFTGSRKDSYDLLHRINANGVGPAFFTKLVRYLRPHASDTGYIMDQWLARSINLIYGRGILMHGQRRNYVHRDNNADVYELFSERIERVAERLNCTSKEIEEFMFASTEWRNWVKGDHP